MIRLKLMGTWQISRKKYIGCLYSTENGDLVLKVYLDQNALELEDKVNIINGVTSDNEPVTLKDCIKIRKRGNYIEYLVSDMFLGEHFDKADDVRFQKVIVSYTNLNSWFDHPNMIQPIPEEKGLIIRATALNTTPVEVNDWRITLRSDPNLRFSDYKTRIELETKIYFQIEPSSVETKEFGDFLYPIRQLQNLITFITTSPSGVEELLGVIGGERDRKVKIYCRTLSRPIGEKVPIGSFLFRFTEIQEKFDKIVYSWFSEDLKPLHEYYFSTIYLPTRYVEDKLIYLIFALESYHRMKYKGEYMCKEDWEIVHKEITEKIKTIKGLSEDHKKALENRLRYGYEYSLRKRLRELYKCHEDIVSMFMNEQLINRAIEIRNEVVHPSNRRSYSVSEVDEITEKLKLFVEVILMKEIGIEEDVIKDLVNELIK